MLNFSCMQNAVNMSEAESQSIIREVKGISDKIIKYSEEANVDSLLSFYNNSSRFLSISSDGKMRNYDEFKKLCTEYYSGLDRQKVSTISEKFNVIDANTVIVVWEGNITAHFKNGDTWKMNNYTVTIVIRKMGGVWKIIHNHESALPPETARIEIP